MEVRGVWINFLKIIAPSCNFFNLIVCDEAVMGKYQRLHEIQSILAVGKPTILQERLQFLLTLCISIYTTKTPPYSIYENQTMQRQVPS